jgi:hypothetical protein
MHIVEVFVPLTRGDGSPVSQNEIRGLVRGLAERFGGATAYSRAPAHGLWKEGSAITHDRIVILEVMAEELDRSWWRDFKEQLERELDQEQILVRSAETQVL